MDTSTLRAVVVVGFQLVSIALLIAAGALTTLEIVALTTVAPIDQNRVVLIFGLVLVAPVVGALIVWEAANRVQAAGRTSNS